MLTFEPNASVTKPRKVEPLCGASRTGCWRRMWGLFREPQSELYDVLAGIVPINGGKCIAKPRKMRCFRL